MKFPACRSVYPEILSLLCVFKNLFCSIFESAVSIITNFRINVFNENGKSGAARRLPDLPGVNQARPAQLPDAASATFKGKREMDSFRFLSYNQYQEMSEMSNSRISIFWATLRHGLQMLDCFAPRRLSAWYSASWVSRKPISSCYTCSPCC